ncbi:MAG: hypothetical protein COB04_12425 [Gammaproteobacteria bacterium]|nr:MAG: hypothetical protein COB04_12425 [Gammaproteobacteria bacterium]
MSDSEIGNPKTPKDNTLGGHDDNNASADTNTNVQPLSFWEVVTQAFCFIFQIQKKDGMKRAADLLETNPFSVVISGVLSTVIFFCVCFGASQIVLSFIEK